MPPIPSGTVGADGASDLGTASGRTITVANSHRPRRINAATAITLSGTAQSVVTETGFDGDNAATWNPKIAVAVPANAVVGTYAGTVTHSVS